MLYKDSLHHYLSKCGAMKIQTGLNSIQKGSLNYQYWATITGCVSIICGGMVSGWPSPALPLLFADDSPLPLTSSEGAWMAVLPSIGAVSGALLGGFIVDKIGRKTTMLITSPIYFTTWVMVAFSASIGILGLARFVQGTADGMIYTVFPMYLGEIADARIRGLLGSSIPVMTTFGILLINVIGTYLNVKVTALVSASIPLLHFIFFYFMPESPYFLIMREKFERAQLSLQKLKGVEDVSEELARLKGTVDADLGNAGTIWDLFTIRSNRKAMLIAATLRTVQQCTGTMAITFYATIIFKESNSGIPPNLAAIIYFTVQLVVSGVFSLLVDKLGRRPLLIISIIGCTITLAMEGLYFYFDKLTNFDLSALHWIPLAALLGYVVIFNVGMGTIPVLMLGELFPTSVKAFALCLADISFAVVVSIVSKLFQIMKDEFGMHVPFLAFAGSSVAGLVFIVYCVPETKGKTLEMIQEELKGNKLENQETDI